MKPQKFPESGAKLSRYRIKEICQRFISYIFTSSDSENFRCLLPCVVSDQIYFFYCCVFNYRLLIGFICTEIKMQNSLFKESEHGMENQFIKYLNAIQFRAFWWLVFVNLSSRDFVGKRVLLPLTWVSLILSANCLKSPPERQQKSSTTTQFQYFSHHEVGVI